MHQRPRYLLLLSLLCSHRLLWRLCQYGQTYLGKVQQVVYSGHWHDACIMIEPLQALSWNARDAQRTLAKRRQWEGEGKWDTRTACVLLLPLLLLLHARPTADLAAQEQISFAPPLPKSVRAPIQAHPYKRLYLQYPPSTCLSIRPFPLSPRSAPIQDAQSKT